MFQKGTSESANSFQLKYGQNHKQRKIVPNHKHGYLFKQFAIVVRFPLTFLPLVYTDRTRNNLSAKLNYAQ